MTGTGSAAALRRGGRVPLLLLAAFAAVSLAMPVGSVAAADTWKANVGASGANGTATLTGPATGAGTLKLALKGLSASTPYAVKIAKGTCAAPGATLYSAGTQRSTAAGKIAKSLTVPAAKMAAIRTAWVAGPVSIRIGTGAKLRCGPFTGGPTATPSPTPAPSLAAKVGVTTYLGYALVDVAVDGSSVWTVDAVSSQAFRLDPTTGTAATTIDYSGGWLNLTLGCALGEGSLWIAATDLFQNGGTVVRIKQGTATVDQRMYVPGFAISVAIGGGSVWASAIGPNALLQIDPAKNQVVKSVALPEGAGGLVYAGGSVWMAGGTSVLRVDPATSAVTKIDLGSEVNDVAFGDGSVWATVDKTGLASAKLVRIDPATSTVVASVDIAGSPWGVAVGSGYAWVAPGDDANPYAIAVSTASNTAVASVTLLRGLGAVAVQGRSAWFVGADSAGGIVTRVDW